MRAKGGPVSRGRPYMVGEKGPEMFSPSHGGDIMPNNAFNKMSISANNLINPEDNLFGGGSKSVINATVMAADIDMEAVAEGVSHTILGAGDKSQASQMNMS